MHAAPAAPDLDLAGLRAHRHRLRDEEECISAWRRAVLARLVLLRDGRPGHGALTLAQLEQALGGPSTQRRRATLRRLRPGRAHRDLPVLPVLPTSPGVPPLAGLPELAELAEAWRTGDVEETVRRLEGAAARLSRLRDALHARLDAATDELAERYRAERAPALRVPA